MALELIKISEFPESSDPKDWIVVSDASGVAYKLSKENLKAFLGTVTVTAPKPIGPSDGTPELDGIYIPTVVGVYPNFGGLERLESDGYVQFIKNGAVYAKVNVPIEVSIPGDLYNLSSEGQDFNLSEAINATPVEARKEGLNITFLKTVGSWTQYRYVGQGLSGWGDIANWQLVEDADEKILDYGLGSMGNSEEVVFDGNGDVSSVIYKNEQGTVIRTDSYQYGTNQIIKEQSLPNGYKRVFLTDLNTLKTSRLGTSYKDLIQHPMSVISTSNGWTISGGATISGDKAILSAFPSVLTYRHNIEPLKLSTTFGLLLKAENNTLSRNMVTGIDFIDAYNVVASSGQNGYVKAIIRSRDSASLRTLQLQLQGTEAGSVTISEIRLFELKEGFQIKYDFENMTASELNIKYPKI